MAELSEKIRMQVLNFSKEKSEQWEKERNLYAVHFELTPSCNFSCVHCYLRDHHQSSQLSYREIIDIIDILYDKGVLFITFTGGEIFARNDFMQIYMYAKRKGFIIELFTNGSLITPEIIETLRQYPPLLVDVSLYGATEETYERVTGVRGAFDKVINVCYQLKNAGIRAALKSPMLTLTIREYREMKALADKIGIPFRASFDIIPTIDQDLSTKNFQIPTAEILRYEFEDALSNRHEIVEKEDVGVRFVNRTEELPLFRCKIGRSSCVIDYNGNLCPCMKFKQAGRKITRESFDVIWKDFGKYVIQKASPDYKCLKCDAYNYCDICPAEMYLIYGDFEYVDETYCKMAEARKRFHERGLSVDDAVSQL